MASPFPGMDPYLEDEALWPAFHQELAKGLYQILLPQLVDRYRARVCQRRYRIEPGADVPATPAEREEHYVEIRERNNGGLITLVDLVSPANKTTAAGRDAYLETRRAAKAQGINIVEIDVVLQGKPMLDYSRDGLPEWDYAVTVSRSAQPDHIDFCLTSDFLQGSHACPQAVGERESTKFLLLFVLGWGGGAVNYLWRQS
jgi:Protein of unknown function (DUF4058)